MIETNELEKIIRSVLQDRFDGITIDSITVVPDRDEDGEPILHVKVVFDGKNKTLDARRAASVVRHLRPKIANFEDAFPVISYIAKSEIAKSKTETTGSH